MSYPTRNKSEVSLQLDPNQKQIYNNGVVLQNISKSYFNFSNPVNTFNKLSFNFYVLFYHTAFALSFLCIKALRCALLFDKKKKKNNNPGNSEELRYSETSVTDVQIIKNLKFYNVTPHNEAGRHIEKKVLCLL